MLNSGVFLWTIVGAHMYSIVQLPEALLPRIVSITFVWSDKLKLARGGVHQWCVIFKHRLVQTFPGVDKIKRNSFNFYRISRC